MATYDLEEQEQISELKTWWKMYGNLVTAVLLAVSAGAVGWQAWNWYQRTQAAEASVIYAAVQKGAMERDPKRVREAAGELTEKYPGTAYAAMAALTSARMQYDAGDLKTARAQLQWVAEKARDRDLRDLGRLRLDTRLLIGLIAAVGLGSLVFHTVATRRAAVLDIGFIGIFVLAYFQRFQVRILGTSEAGAWRGLGGFVLLAGLFGLATRALPALPLNGSEIYLPPFALLLLCAWRARPRAPATAMWLLRASGLFVLSITCRAIDQAVCTAWPLGTHMG